MDVSSLIRQRLIELGLDQKDLAAAAHVTESYISQLLARKKAPPAPGRTEIYEKIGEFLRLPSGELSRLAEVQRLLELKKKIAAPAMPLFGECRELILRKCQAARRGEVRRIFAKDAFGELEHLVMQKLLDVAQGVARQEVDNEEWLRRMAGGRGLPQTRAAIVKFVEMDLFHISNDGGVRFLEPLLESWDIDLRTFGMDVVLNGRLTMGGIRRFEFMEKAGEAAVAVEPGFEEFLKDKALSGDATREEIESLQMLRFKGRRPGPIYYYRELQNLRDPLHFPASAQPAESNGSPE